MPSSGSSKAQSWKLREKEASGGAIKARRVTLSLMALSLIAFLGVIIARGLWPQPELRLVALPIDDYAMGELSPVLFARDDVQSLLSQSKAERVTPIENLTSIDANTLRRLPHLVRAMGDDQGGKFLDGDDIAMLYLVGHGMVDFATTPPAAQLLCSDYQARGRSGRVDIAEALQTICTSPAKTRVLVIDTGRLSSDSRVGSWIEAFPWAVEQAVKNNPGDYWLLLSHDLLESSQIVPAERRSVFGYFFTEGLNGAAPDKNEDHWVGMDELAGFVQDRVSRWVWVYSDRTKSQTPVLLHGQTGRVDLRSPSSKVSFPNLAPRRPAPPPTAPAGAKTAGLNAAPVGAASRAALSIRLRSPDLPATSPSYRSFSLFASPVHAAEFAQLQPTPNVPTAPAATPAPAATQPGTPPPAVPSPAPTTTAPPATPPGVAPAPPLTPAPPVTPLVPATTPAGDASGLSPIALDYQTRVRELVARLQKFADRPAGWTAADYAPHLWRRCRQLARIHQWRVFFELKHLPSKEEPLTLGRWLRQLGELDGSVRRLELDRAEFLQGKAVASYQATAELTEAVQLRNDLLQRIPDLMEWHAQSGTTATFDRLLTQVIDSTQKLCDLFRQPAASPDNTAVDIAWTSALQTTTREARLAWDAIESELDSEITRRAQDQSNRAAGNRVLEALLSPAVDGRRYDQRQRRVLELAWQSIPAPEPLSAFKPALPGPAEINIAELQRDQWSGLIRNLKINAKLMNVFHTDPNHPGQVVIDSQLKALDELFRRQTTAIDQWSSAVQAPAAGLTRAWQDMPSKLGEQLGKDTFVAWRTAELYAQLADPRDSTQIDEMLRASAGRLWQHPIWGVPVGGFRLNALRLQGPEQFAATADGKPVTSIKLLTGQWTPATWIVESDAPLSSAPKVVLEYDVAKLRLRNQFQEPIQPGEQPRIAITSGSKRFELRWQVMAEGEPGGAAPITMRVITTDATVDRKTEFGLPRRTWYELYVRQTSPRKVEEMVAFDEQAPGASYGVGRKFLDVYPGRLTRYQLELRNPGDIPRKVRCRILKLPDAAPTREDRTAWPWDDGLQWRRDAVGEPTTLGSESEIAIEAGGRAALVIGATPADPKAPAPATPDKPATPPAAENVSGGLIVAIDEVGSSRQQRFWLPWRMLHPDNYLSEPELDYLYDQSALRVRIDNDVIVPGLEQANVRWTVPPDYTTLVQPDQKNVLAGIVGADASKRTGLELFLYLIPGRVDQQMFPVLLSVDGYPRAFFYKWERDRPKVTRSRTNLDWVRWTAYRVDPAVGWIPLKPPARDREIVPLQAVKLDRIDVRLEADVPPPRGNEQHVVRIGVVPSATSEFDPANHPEQVRFLRDRHSRVLLNSPPDLKPGEYAFLSEIEDLEATIDLRGFRDQRVALRAEIAQVPLDRRADLTVKKFDTQILLLDSQPPNILPRVPSTVDKGQELLVTASVDDPGVNSGVSKVEFTFPDDANGVKVPGVLQPGTSTYVAPFKTMDRVTGRYKGVVEAVDNVGNKSPRIPFEVVIAAPPPIPTAPAGGEAVKNNTLRGKVTVPGAPNARMSSVRITLTGTKPLVTTADSSGNFEIKDLPPGPYKVKAKGIASNREQESPEVDVTIKSPPEAPAQVELPLSFSLTK